ncbi:MAG: GMC family oxidoreductase [Myxococcales bacterium]
MSFDFDVVIVGSGFGGSVTALRLAERGKRVCVLEQGRRPSSRDLERAGDDPRALAWAPDLKLTGVLSLDVFRHLAVLRGVGVGGGSLIYAGVLLEPRASFFRSPAWSHLSADFATELAPHFASVRRMLGVADNPYKGLQDEWLARAAARMGKGDTYGTVPQGIFFGDSERETPDPFFGGAGPARRGCTQCGRCLSGCAYGAKNSLDLNYLHLAERHGARILSERQVTHVEPLPGGGYRVHQRHAWDRSVRHAPISARQVVLAAGVLGTLEVLFASRDRYRSLPALPPSLGRVVRTNSEALVGILARDREQNLTHGATISSHFYPNEKTHITQNRLPPSFDLMRFGMGPLVDGPDARRRALRVLSGMAGRPVATARTQIVSDWHRRMTMLTVMQDTDTELAFGYGRTPFRGLRRGLTSQAVRGAQLAYIREANEAARAFAEASGGTPLNSVLESVGNLSVTAHILGGAVMAPNPEQGVIDRDHQVFGYAGLYVVDGSALPVNVGVNPSLTIAALAERFAARFLAREAEAPHAR